MTCFDRKFSQEVAAALNTTIRGDYIYFEIKFEVTSSYDPLSLLSLGMLPDYPDYREVHE
ncbi:MAG: hypothetical protein ACTSX1_10190 [Candidatus Heimdallarchaeaceae archaeon]